MKTAYDFESFVKALAQPARADLQPLLTEHLRHTLDAGLADITRLLVVEAINSEAELKAAVGFTPLTNPLDGSRFGDGPKYTPWFDGLRDCGGWYEMIICAGNSGFAFILLIEERDDELGRLCREHATR